MSAAALMARVDAAIGTRIDRSICAHHRRPRPNESAHDRKLWLLRGVSRRTQALRGPISGLLLDG